MNIVISNSDGDALKALAIGKQLFNAIIGDGVLKRAVQWTAGGDIYHIRALKMGPIQRLEVINVNPFRITSAVNYLEKGLEYPEIQWQGGTPPFQVQVVYRDADGIYQTVMAGKLVNLDPNLIDGTGDSTTNRNYYLYRVTDTDGWWADDGTGAKQDAIGFLITDSAGRKLFAPFTPAVDDPLARLYSHYGPPEWCLPKIAWVPPRSMVYGHVLDIAYLNALANVPGTTDNLPGAFTYRVTVNGVPTVVGEKPDGGALTLTPPEGYKPNATAPNSLDMTVEFQATDATHYHLATLLKQILVVKAGQTAPLDLAGISINNQRLQPGNSVWVAVLVGDPLAMVLATSLPPSGLPWHTTSSNTNICTVANGGILTLQTKTANYGAGDMFYLQPGTYTAYMVQITAITVGYFVLSTHIEGDSNYTPSTDLTTNLAVYLPMNAPGGIYFDINTSPISYGEPLDFTLTNNSGIAPNSINYPEKSDPANPSNIYQGAGWSVDPLWGTFLETNADGTDHVYSITAVFHPYDTATYPDMGYEQWLTVTKDTPVIVWNPPASWTYGQPWSVLNTAKAYNSHHVGAQAWEVDGVFTYTVTDKTSDSGVISNFNTVPDADSGFYVTVSFEPSGTKAHNYNNPTPVQEGMVIGKATPSLSMELTNSAPYVGDVFGASISTNAPGSVSISSNNTGVVSVIPPYSLQANSAGTVTIRCDLSESTNYVAAYTTVTTTVTMRTWHTLFDYSCGQVANLQYNVGSYWYAGTVRRLSADGTMAVTWGWLNDPTLQSSSEVPGTLHGPNEVASTLGVTTAQMNAWFWPNLSTQIGQIHVIKIERYY